MFIKIVLESMMNSSLFIRRFFSFLVLLSLCNDFDILEYLVKWILGDLLCICVGMCICDFFIDCMSLGLYGFSFR